MPEKLSPDNQTGNTSSHTTLLNLNAPMRQEDYLNGHKLNARKRRFWLSVLAVGLGALCFILAAYSSAKQPLQEIYFLSLGGFLVLYGLLLGQFIFTLRVLRHWKQQNRKRALQLNWKVTEAGIYGRDDADKPVLIHWENMDNWLEDSHLFLIRLPSLLWIALPKHLFSETVQKELRHLLKEKLKAG
ncbi:YcxB family protein [Candidatus Venteria ishoeyi]|uniref:Uncharacterized protein n=1 Tax=Candidatus Venteria ishoeyi TaxID=1899563 RepID=A0A1H6F601_9GAMM|nr:YcxB family protein [Candidatus Venteria ishoeyi]MDM8547721.1 YcxB family protein [Candidatus Venteria ishoeyi]SEH04415.1 Uncharacterised protein [Candidatus Venteria ishoeyi]